MAEGGGNGRMRREAQACGGIQAGERANLTQAWTIEVYGSTPCIATYLAP